MSEFWAFVVVRLHLSYLSIVRNKSKLSMSKVKQALFVVLLELMLFHRVFVQREDSIVNVESLYLTVHEKCSFVH